MSIFSVLADQAEASVRASNHFGVMSNEGFKYSSYKKFGMSIVDICLDIVTEKNDESSWSNSPDSILKERQRIKDEILNHFFGDEIHE